MVQMIILVAYPARISQFRNPGCYPLSIKLHGCIFYTGVFHLKAQSYKYSNMKPLFLQEKSTDHSNSEKTYL
jgi:hypothetical protein